MLEDLAVRQFSEATRRSYIRHIVAFAECLGRSPETATADNVCRFQVHISERGAGRRSPTVRPRRGLASLAKASTALSSLGIPRQRALLQTATADALRRRR